MMRLGVITLIPEFFDGMQWGVLGRALRKNLVQVDVWNLRNWGTGKYKKVDDKPYGGGPGMVMQYKPLSQAIQLAKSNMPVGTKIIYLSPQGKVVQQSDFNQLAAQQQPLLFLAGRYEGIDERVIEEYVDEEWSVGDYVLSGGELPVFICIDAIVRLLPGALGNLGSAGQDSFMSGLLDCPHYTRPACIDNKAVPRVLLEGDHHKVAQWRRKQCLGKTWLKKPDILIGLKLSTMDQKLLEDFKLEYGASILKRQTRSDK